MVEQTQSQKNHIHYRKFYFNEFVANVLRDNMGIIIFDLWNVEAVRGQKHHISPHTQCSVHPKVPVLLTKDSIRNEISYNFQPPFSLHISNSRTYSMFPIKRTVFLCTETLVKNTVRLIGNIEQPAELDFQFYKFVKLCHEKINGDTFNELFICCTHITIFFQLDFID